MAALPLSSASCASASRRSSPCLGGSFLSSSSAALSSSSSSRMSAARSSPAVRRFTPASRSSRASAGARPASSRAVVVRSFNSSGSASLSESSGSPASIRLPSDAPRLALPSKGRMAEDAMSLLRDCQLQVVKPNPRQYVAHVSQMPGLEVWFQRASDVVRKVALGDVDLGIVGTDMVEELACAHPDVVVVHEALGFGKCRLALGVPSSSRWAGVDSIEALRDAGWTAERPLRVVSGYADLARRFFEERGFEHVRLLSGDGALEAAPAMGTADIILDLVSSGVTLRENNLREIEGGTVLQSQGVLIANRKSLLERRGLLPIVRELLERLDAHLTAEQFYNVVANMRGASPEGVAAALLAAGESLQGLQGPTVSPVYTKASGAAPAYYAAQVCVPRKTLYETIKAIRGAGGSGVLVLPVTYIFNEETERWLGLINKLGISEEDVDAMEREQGELEQQRERVNA